MAKITTKIQRDVRPLERRSYDDFPRDLVYECPDIRPADYLVLDFETTGLGSSDEIIEIACLRVWKGVPSKIFACKTKTTKPIPYEVTKLTGITQDMMDYAYSLQAAGENLAKFIGIIKRPIFAHNAGFEAKHLFMSGLAELISPDNPICDSILLAKAAFPALGSYSLDALSHDLKLRRYEAHRASGDVLCTAQLIERCYDKLEGKLPDISQLELPLIAQMPPCPKCKSALVCKDGFTQAGTQMYRCKSCNKKFH